MKSVHATLLCAALLAPSVASGSAEWPNEPSGSSLLLDCNFDHPTCNGRLSDAYNTSGTLSSPPSAHTLNVVSDGTAPLSPSNVIQSTENYLTGNGGTELGYIAPTPITEVYVGYWWRTNPEFTGNQVSANKTLFIRGTGGGTNGVFYLRTNPGDPKVLYWSTQLAYNLDQCFGAPDQDACWPNVNTTPIIPGTWYRIEIYMKASSCPTCHDGIVRWWITPKGGSPVLQANYLNFAYGPRVDTVLWSETWDGAGNGLGFTSNPSHYLDHLHISAPNCPSGCTVPVSDTTPPSRATGLTITQLN